ncbi:hypothetical protein EYZ11_007734 [Aspergillus tanneri]|uniref:Major facilitator superfamily (MFS) profile domain-containing protein n=1 Tax=Aspergillus tanneri TaxID=1220188 RepID=A0A4S3JC73_9EURO|nr:hypothetical protein EYZ11_007734 [Aspergillus tanneri]
MAENQKSAPKPSLAPGPEDSKGQIQLSSGVQDAHEQAEPYCVYGRITKAIIVLGVSIAGCFSPFATNMYLPALNELAKDLHRSIPLINLSMTTYLIFQGLTPALLGPLMDRSGRRPIYIICFVLYFASNVGLALQRSYGALLGLRAMQSAGSSSTISLASAVVADIATRAERGVYMGYTFAGFLAGQTLSPVLGGILSNYLGWPWIFWFLAIFSAAFLLILLLFLPETSRLLVGNGSRRPPRYSLCLLDLVPCHGFHIEPRIPSASAVDNITLSQLVLGPWASLQVLLDRRVGLVILANGVNFCGTVAVTTSQPSLFKEIYDLTDLQVGLCFLPFGIGGILASYAQGKLTDWNYRRHERRRVGQGSSFANSLEGGSGMAGFPLERARGEMLPPLAAMQCAASISYGWMLQHSVHLAGPLIALFLLGYTAAAIINCLNVLTIDLYSDRPAMAMGVTNLTRCLLGAGASAAIGPLIEHIGRGVCNGDDSFFDRVR